MSGLFEGAAKKAFPVYDGERPEYRPASRSCRREENRDPGEDELLQAIDALGGAAGKEDLARRLGTSIAALVRAAARSIAKQRIVVRGQQYCRYTEGTNMPQYPVCNSANILQVVREGADTLEKLRDHFGITTTKLGPHLGGLASRKKIAYSKSEGWIRCLDAADDARVPKGAGGPDTGKAPGWEAPGGNADGQGPSDLAPDQHQTHQHGAPVDAAEEEEALDLRKAADLANEGASLMPAAGDLSIEVRFRAEIERFTKDLFAGMQAERASLLAANLRLHMDLERCDDRRRELEDRLRTILDLAAPAVGNARDA